MTASRRSVRVQQDYGYGRSKPTGVADSVRSPTYPETSQPAYDPSIYYASTSASFPSNYGATAGSTSGTATYLPEPTYSAGYNVGSSSGMYGTSGSGYVDSYTSQASSWEAQGYDFVPSPNPDYLLDSSSHAAGKAKVEGKHSSQRKPSNRDEFDGPHQFLRRPPSDYIAQQDRDLPHLPTNLIVQEQDKVLTLVNDRLSQCAFDFVAKYQFPIPISSDMRPVERPLDRTWVEWVFLLKRLATKRRIPARVLYQQQIKQFVTILENSLEMRSAAAKHQSRPLKDDRNILQLVSAAIQVAKLLKDAEAMDYLDRLYVQTEQQIKERSGGRYRP